MDKTIVYYTSNREDPVFEKKIMECLNANKGDSPIISVSQIPMDLGQNVCVGDIGFSYLNEYKQILEGVKLATTDYIITAESDFLYPPEYFQIEPKGKNIYRYDNIWIMALSDKNCKFYQKKRCSEGAQLVKRDYFIEILEKYISNPDPFHSPYYKQPWFYIHGESPCISFKTGKGMNSRTGLKDREGSTYLPYWGEACELKDKFL